MAPNRPQIRSSLLPFMLVLALVGLVFLVPLSSASESKPSPSANVDLICHTDNQSECYPKIFQPTDEFQTVHDDQDIPSGLHVRLNLSTGKKEAKINVPDEENPALAGLPVDRSVILVDPEPAQEKQIPRGAPQYESVGAIKKPVESSGQFYSDLTYMKKGADGNDLPYDEALESLEEISHDIYYGVKITEDFETLKSLVCIMVDPEDVTVPEGTTPRAQQAALILAGALQNNPTALQEVTKVWPALMAAECKKGGADLKTVFYSSIMPYHLIDNNQVPRAAAQVKARVAAINGLIKSEVIRDHFLASKGMSTLLEVLVPEEEEWSAAQRKVGQLVLDNFLDESMGATLGVWPKGNSLGRSDCRKPATMITDGCWDYHVGRAVHRNKDDKDHWSKDLFDRLAAQRKVAKEEPRAKEEL